LAATQKRQKKRRRKPKTKPPELRPFKIVGQLIGALYDEQGEIVGEQVMGEVAIYRKSFAKVPELVDDAWRQSKEMEKAIKESRGATGGN
jgi:hypothetical protein